MVHRILKLFSSSTLGVLVLGILAVACIHGSLLASDSRFGAAVASTVVFHSWWFIGLEALLALNLLFCSGRRIISAPGLRWKRDFRKSKEFYRRALINRTLSHQEGIERATGVLSPTFTTFRSDMNAIHAQKGICGAWGAPLVHSGILLILLSGLLRCFLIQSGGVITDGKMYIPEGETVSRFYVANDRSKPFGTNNMTSVPLEFEICCRDFSIDLFPGTSIPKGYSSKIGAIDKTRSITHTITMTSPFRHKGFNMHQVHYGERFRFRVYPDPASGNVLIADAGFGEPVSIPELGKTVVFQKTPDRIEMIPVASFREKESIQLSALPGIEILGTTGTYYTLLGVSRDQTVWMVYPAAVMIILGSVFAFFLPYTQLWAFYDQETHSLHLALKSTRTPELQERLMDGLINRFPSGEVTEERENDHDS